MVDNILILTVNTTVFDAGSAHSVFDFIFRFKLPYAEEFMLEKEDSFWKYLESLRQKDVSEE